VKILITGASGQLGRCLQEEIKNYDYSLSTLCHSDLDISNFDAVERVLSFERPDYVINAAAFTNVPGAEKAQNIALSVNGHGPTNLAISSAKHGIKLIHISTNFVFDGDANSFLDVGVPTNPQNFYGVSKLAGERGVITNNPQGGFIIRTSSLFSEYENNFVNKILSKLNENDKEISVVNDQYCQPTYARDLARQIIALIESKLAPGTYHGVNVGHTTWFEFAQEIAKLSGFKSERVIPISSSSFDDGVKRPKSALLKPTLLSDSIYAGRNWLSALNDCLERRKNEK
jgi:dTDP-4-dehydrorhamnose reductase